MKCVAVRDCVDFGPGDGPGVRRTMAVEVRVSFPDGFDPHYGGGYASYGEWRLTFPVPLTEELKAEARLAELRRDGVA